MVYYIIRDQKGNIKRNNDNTILMFEYPRQAERTIENKYGNSPYLNIHKWKTKKKATQ